MAGKGFTTKYGTPLGDSAYQDPTDALATLLGVDSTTGPVNTDNAMQDPSLELASLRGQRENELRQRTAMGTDTRASGLLKMLQGEQAADPVTGLAAQKAANKSREDYTNAVVLNSPSNPLAQEEAAKENFQIRLAEANHPNPNVSPFVSGAPGMGGHGVTPPHGVDPSVWAEKTADMTPDAASKLAQVLEYKAALPTGNALARPEWSAILGRARQVDPTFDAKNYAARQAYLTQYEKSNVPVALDTVMQHLGSLDTAAQGLHNTGLKPWNWLMQGAANMTTGNPALQKFEGAANAVEGELSNVFKATGATDQEIKSWRSQLSSSATPEEFQAKLGELVDLIKGRMNAVTSRYQTVMGREPANPLSESSQQIWQQFQNRGTGLPQGVTVRRVQ